VRTKLITTKLVLVVLVSVAAIVISLNAGGGLEPDGPPGPAMHTLDEIYNAVVSPNEPSARPMAYDMFLKIEGVPGESTDKDHRDWIEILSYSHGVTMSVEPGVVGGGRTTARSEHRDFSVVKEMDKASPKLALHCCKGDRLTNIKLELCRTDGGREKYMEYERRDVIVTAVRPQGDPASGGDRPTEEVTLNYGKIAWTYTEFDPNTRLPVGDVEAQWDVTLNEGH